MRNISLFIIAILFVTGCVSQKESIYLQDAKKDSGDKSFSNIKSVNTIRVFDQIYIQVSSFDDGNINFMSNDPNRYGGGRTEADLAMVSYTVNKDGEVKLPIVGASKVVGLTTDQAAEEIRKQLENYLNTPSIKVTFVNKSITVLGSVSHPGRYFYASEYLNVFQALGMAGDITEYGNRKEVVIVRDVNNEVVRKRVNLTELALLGQDELYIQADDVLYIEPLKRRQWGFEAFPWALVLSSITTIVLVANYVGK